LKGKTDNLNVYIDDLLIDSQMHEQHLATLDMVKNHRSVNNKKINLSKCFFGNTEAIYLCFRLTSNGAKAVKTAKVPATKEENIGRQHGGVV
jgi:hypothetical protein